MENCKKVAFILHPLSVNEFSKKSYLYHPFAKFINFLLRTFPPRVSKYFYSILPPHIVLPSQHIKSPEGNLIDIFGVMCPMFPDEVVFNRKRAVIKVYEAIKYSVKKGAAIIVLTGFTSIATNEGEDFVDFAKVKNVIVTSGNTLTAALCIKSIEKITEIFELKLNQLSFCVIGATGDIGSACARVLSRKFKKTILCSRNITELNSPVELTNLSVNVQLECDIDKAVSSADVILLATSSYIPLLKQDSIKANTIICDVSLPHNIDRDICSQRPDIFVYDGGLAKIHSNFDLFKWKKFIQTNQIFGCVAEGILLGFEKTKENYSVGRGRITEKKILELLQQCIKNGIELGDYSFYGKKYVAEDFHRLKKTIGH